MAHAYPVCHREERSNAAISSRGGVRCPDEIATLSLAMTNRAKLGMREFAIEGDAQ